MLTIYAAIAGALMLQAATPTVTEQLQQEAAAMKPLVRTPLAAAFLDAVPCLPAMDARTIWYNKESRDAVIPENMKALAPDALAGYEETDIDARFYYYTRYGTPVAFVRPLEILGRAGVKSADGLKIADFGFGTVGQLRALASLGAHATGIEVDRMLRAIYSSPGDTGTIARCAAAGKGDAGTVDLVFGHFPAEASVTGAVGGGYDVFISKNTLKRGYIHPEQAVDPRRLVQLRVDDETFLRAVFDMLKPGGFALIYNLSPAPSKPDEPYKNWADGRSPWPQGLYERVGFAVVAFDQDDTDAAREMGKALGWGEQMDLTSDLFATYTLLRKPR